MASCSTCQYFHHAPCDGGNTKLGHFSFYCHYFIAVFCFCVTLYLHINSTPCSFKKGIVGNVVSLTIVGKFQLWMRFNVAEFGFQFLAGYHPSFWFALLVVETGFYARWIWIWPPNVAHAQTKWSVQPCRSRAIWCRRVLQFVVAVPSQGALTEARALLWQTFSVWRLPLFINPMSVPVAQKPETAAEGRGSEGEGMKGNIMPNLRYCVRWSLSHEWLTWICISARLEVIVVAGRALKTRSFPFY